MRRIDLPAALLTLAACHHAPAPAPDTRPDWRGATVDGVAPLMSPRQVEAALERHGYRQIACGGRGKVRPEPLDDPADNSACFQSRSSGWHVILFMMDLNEGRRLAVASFHEPYTLPDDDDSSLARSRAWARRLRGWLGRPDSAMPGGEFTTYYWLRRGGRTNAPDMIAATVGRTFGANVELTSMWAYGQQRPSKQPPTPRPTAPATP